MIGNSSTRVSNNIRADEDSDNHFRKKVRAYLISNSFAEFEGRSSFDDSGSPNPLNVSVNHRKLAFSSVQHEKIYNCGVSGNQ